MSLREVATFSVDGRWFAIDVARAQEVLPIMPMTRVPLAPPAIEGLINLRGQIVTAIDLRRRFGFPPSSNDRPPMNLVVNLSGGLISLLVDEMGEVLQVDEDSFESPPATLDGTLRELITGAYKLPSRLLVTLDINKLTSVES